MDKREEVAKILLAGFNYNTPESIYGQADRICQLFTKQTPEFNNSLEADAHNWDTRELETPELSEALTTLPKIETCAGCPYYKTYERTDPKARGERFPKMLCKLEADKILSLIGDIRREERERIMERLKPKLGAEHHCAYRLVDDDEWQSLVDTGDEWARVDGSYSWRNREKAFEEGKRAQLEHDLSLIDEQATQEKIDLALEAFDSGFEMGQLETKQAIRKDQIKWGRVFKGE